MRFTAPLLMVFLLFSVLTSCSKDDTLYTGTLQVTVAYHPSDLTVVISPIENPDVIISKQMIPDWYGSVTCDLNPGNYILKYSSTTNYNDVGFQIRAGVTTEIKYDANHIGSVQ